MKLSNFWCSAALLCVWLQSALCQFAGLYCGEISCYDVLGVDRDTPRAELSRIYRKLAAEAHPDKHKGDQAKEDAQDRFRLIATAYETLKDEETRRDYDYMLDHPEEYYYNYYKYYRRRVAPHVDARLVVLATVLIISIVQYIGAVHKYNEAIAYLMTQAKYRLQAQTIAKERGLLGDGDKKARRKQNKVEQREREEQIIRGIIEEKVDIKGGYKRPSIMNTLAVQIVFLPVTLCKYIAWNVRWLYKFTLCGQEYTDVEKIYLIRRNMGLSEDQFMSLEDEKHDEFFERELWRREKWLVYKQEQDESQRRKLAESGRYKQYRRYMKNQGPGQYVPGDED